MTKERLSAAERRTKTLEAVAKVFATEGFSASTATLARAAGISEAMLYKLFKTKHGLYEAMLEHKLADAGWGEFPIDPEVAEPREFFLAMARSIFQKVEADPDFARLLLFSDLQGNEFTQLFHEATGVGVKRDVADYVRRKVADGALREVDPEVSSMAFLIMTWQYAVCSKVLPYERLPQRSDEQVIETLVEVFLRGVRP